MYHFILTFGDFLFRTGLGKLIDPWILAADKYGNPAFRPYGRFGGAYRFHDEPRLRFVVHFVLVMLAVFLAGVVFTLGIFGWQGLLLWTVICVIFYRVVATVLVMGTDRISILTGKIESPINESDYMVVLIRRFVASGWIGFGSLVLALTQPNYTALWWVGTIVAIVCGIILACTMITLARQ